MIDPPSPAALEAPQAGPALVRVVLPEHLRVLAGVTGEVELTVPRPVTLARLLNQLEGTYPALAGTIVDRATGRRRALVRFFAARHDLSHEDLQSELPTVVQDGTEPFVVVGAMAGG